ncbi:Filaggrin-like protein [Hirschfeldia incana]|nr:Filaggrin-like protein [Hirschfeldia incana]
MQYYETRGKEYYDVAQGQTRQAYGQNQHQGYGQSQTRPVYGKSPTLNHRSHGGFLDGLFKGKNGQKDHGIGTFLGHKSQEANKGHGHGNSLGQHEKKTHETNKGLHGLGTFIHNGEMKHKKRDEHKKKKNKDGHGSGNESGSSSGSDSD